MHDGQSTKVCAFMIQYNQFFFRLVFSLLLYQSTRQCKYPRCGLQKDDCHSYNNLYDRFSILNIL